MLIECTAVNEFKVFFRKQNKSRLEFYLIWTVKTILQLSIGSNLLNANIKFIPTLSLRVGTSGSGYQAYQNLNWDAYTLLL